MSESPENQAESAYVQVSGLTRRDFKSHRYRTMRTPDFNCNGSEVGGFRVSRKAILGTLWAHFFDDQPGKEGSNKFPRPERDLERRGSKLGQGVNLAR
jgi:hypothetical protein